MDKILGFIDLLGFSRMVEENSSKARDVLNDFYNISFDVIKAHDNIKGSLFSDSLLIHSEEYAELINCITEIYRRCLRKNGTYSHGNSFFCYPEVELALDLLILKKGTPHLI